MAIVKRAEYTEDTISKSRYFSTKEKKLLLQILGSAQEEAASGEWERLINLRNHIAKQISSRRLVAKKRVGEVQPYVGELEKGIALARQKPAERNARLLAKNLEIQQRLASVSGISGVVQSRRLSDPNSQARYYRQQEQFQRVMQRDYRQSLRTGDDDELQYALGADTGVGDDFDYLRKRERRERAERVRQYLKTKRARAKGAERIAQHQSDINYQRNLLNMTPRERERHELIMQYGGGPEGIALADEALRHRQDERVEAARQRIASQKSEGRYAYNLDQMTDYQRERHELVKRYGSGAEGQSLADAEMNRRADRRHREAEARGSIRNRRERLMLMREFPTFFKNSRMSTRDIKSMAKTLRQFKKIPFIGKALTGSPVSQASLVIAATNALLGVADRANADVLGYQNKFNLYGAPTQAFMETAFLAGAKNIGEISQRFGKAQLNFGDAEMFYRTIGESLRGQDHRSKLAVAQSLGFDETDIMIADIMAGNVSPNRARRVAANTAIVDTMNEMGWSSSAGIGDQAQALWNLLFGKLQARDAADFEYAHEALMKSAYEQIGDIVTSATTAAQSDVAYDQARYDTPEAPATAASQSISFSINGPVNVTANDAGEFVGSLVDESKSRGGSEILEALDTTKEK